MSDPKSYVLANSHASMGLFLRATGYLKRAKLSVLFEPSVEISFRLRFLPSLQKSMNFPQ